MYYPDRAEEDARLLTYTGAPLEGALRITGTPVVSLQLSSNKPDGALHVYLEDVAPDGRVTYLTEGILRLIHRSRMTPHCLYEQSGPSRSFFAPMRGRSRPAMSFASRCRCTPRPCGSRRVIGCASPSPVTTHRPLPDTPTPERRPDGRLLAVEPVPAGTAGGQRLMAAMKV